MSQSTTTTSTAATARPKTYWTYIRGGSLELALRVVFQNAPGGKVAGYSMAYDGSQMVLYWSISETAKGVAHFPAPLSVEEVLPLVKAWLDRTAKYGTRPDTDGDTEKSFVVYNETWHHVNEDHYAFAAIEPLWEVYGK